MKAFPSTEPIYRNDVIGVKENSGMDLRDYFAGQAMQAMLGWDNDHTIWDSYAEDAYMMADAMLKAR
jgi:hypothetical protein